MHETNNSYSFSLFKPLNQYGRSNRNLIIILISVWFVAIFGFQLLLLILQEPTPEKALLTYQAVSGKVKSGTSELGDKQQFINTLMMVSGKSLIKPDDRIILHKAISWAVYDIIGEEQEAKVAGYVAQLNETRTRLATADDTEYVGLQAQLTELKANINLLANEPTGVDPMNLKASILPYSLNTEKQILSDQDWKRLDQMMSFYLTHNQSVLTNASFLGFPFHYFYTSEFLLFLFVGICLFYSYRITQLQKKYSVQE